MAFGVEEEETAAAVGQFGLGARRNGHLGAMHGLRKLRPLLDAEVGEGAVAAVAALRASSKAPKRSMHEPMPASVME